MLHSGLEPELLAGQVYQAGNVAPTRIGQPLVFAPHDFRGSRRHAARAIPASGAPLVKRLQPRASVVGKGEQAPRAAVVCFDCENFTSPGAADIVANSARNLRARLGEISQAMGINLPVYVLFTKIDRLPFFTEYVRNLSNDESTQVLGVTLPMIDRPQRGRLRGGGDGAAHRAISSGCSARWRMRAPSFWRAKTMPPSCRRRTSFRASSARSARPLVQFLVDLCRPSQLTVGPFLRGFYFTGVRPVIVNESAPVAAAAPQPAGVCADPPAPPESSARGAAQAAAPAQPRPRR